MFRCCTEGEIEQHLGLDNPRTELECRLDLTRQCVRTIAPYATAILARRVTFDGVVMDGCLKALVAPEGVCATVAPALPWKLACMDSAWSGQVATGGKCHHAFECAGHDSICAPNETCQTLPGAGQACTAAQPCATGFYCGGDRICHAQGATSAVCSSTVQCQKALYCETHATPPVCTPLHGNGEPCTGNSSCTSNRCLPGTCGVSMNPCFTDADCSFQSFCADDHSFCNQDGQCALGTCSTTATSCFSQADCVGFGNTCVLPVPCVPDTCPDRATCADDQIVVDYCTSPLASLPIPNAQ
jgi:hypothetical protein